jgi:hypothetical protein
MPALGLGIGLVFRNQRTRPGYRVTVGTLFPGPGDVVPIYAQRLNTDGSDDHTSGIDVDWTKIGIGGSLSASSGTTDTDGRATVNLTVSSVLYATFSVRVSDSEGRTGISPRLLVDPVDNYLLTLHPVDNYLLTVAP